MICSTEQALGWTAVLGGREVGEICEVMVEGDTEITLKGQNHSLVKVFYVLFLTDVLVGDVWFCAGQSNLGWVLGGAENGSQEVETSQPYTNIR